jgi:hypothetical protein
MDVVISVYGPGVKSRIYVSRGKVRKPWAFVAVVQRQECVYHAFTRTMYEGPRHTMVEIKPGVPHRGGKPASNHYYVRVKKRATCLELRALA